MAGGSKFNMKQILNNASINEAAGAAADSPPRSAMKIDFLSVNDLVPSSDNFYSVDNIAELKTSIEMHGVKQCLTVVPLGNGKYKVLAGHRRRLACLALLEEGKKEFEFIPCGIEPGDDETADNIIMITTNSTTRQLSDWEKIMQAARLRRHYEELKKRENLPGRVRDMVTEALNTSNTQVARMDAISNNLSDDFKEEIKSGKMGISVAYELAGLPEEVQREAFLQYAEQGGFSLNDARGLREGCADVAETLREEEKTPDNAPPADIAGPAAVAESPVNNTDDDLMREIEEGEAALWNDFKNAGGKPAPEASPDESPEDEAENQPEPQNEEKRDFADMTVSEKADSAIALLNYYRFTLFQPGTDTRIYDFIIDTLAALGEATAI